jgi:Uma2 family endonuclease
MIELVSRKITVQEFQEMEFPENDFFIYELIKGEIMKKNAPSPLHQKIAWRIAAIIDKYLRENPIGQAFFAPIDVFFDEYSKAQPDLLFISEACSFIVDLQNGIMGAPDLIVEIISRGSIKADRFDKKQMYKEFAVKEFWLIDPKNETLEIYKFENDDYTLHQFLEVEGKIDSIVLKDLDLEFKEVFL